MKAALILALLVVAAIPVKADDLVYVNAWEVTWTYGIANGQTVYNPGAEIFWTFGPGLAGPYPVDPNAQDFAYYGYQLPFTIEGSYNGPNNDQVWAGRDLSPYAQYYASNTNVYFPIYGIDTTPNPTASFSGWVNITDTNGFISGLPFEEACTTQCTNLIFPEPAASTAEFDYLNHYLAPATPTPEPSSLLLLGVGLIGVAFTIRYKQHFSNTIIEPT